MRISDWSSDVCSSDLAVEGKERQTGGKARMPGPGADEAEDVALDAMRPQPFVEVAEEQQRRRTVGRDAPAERGDLAAALVAAEADEGGDQTQAEGRQEGVRCHHLARSTSASGEFLSLLCVPEARPRRRNNLQT